MSEPSHRSSS